MFELLLPNLKACAFGIACKYEYKHIMINCIEELNELQKDLCKVLRKEEGGYPNINSTLLKIRIIEEIANVYITIEEIKYLNKIKDDEIFKIMKEKIDRGVI